MNHGRSVYGGLRSRSLLGLLVFVTTAVITAPVLGYEKEVQALSTAMADQIAASGKKAVAVVDFTDLQGNVTELGRFLAEEFSAALASAGKGFEVIDRNNLKSIMHEQKLATTGIIDPATAKKLGQIAGVDALITGTLTPFGETVRLSIKILDTTTAKVIGATRGDIPKTKAIEELLGRSLSGEAPGARPSSQGGAPSPGGSTAAGSPGTQVVSAESEEFRFEARSCKRMPNRHLECTLLVTNLDQKERELSLNNYNQRCSVIDDQGIAYEPRRIVFGTESRADTSGQGIFSNLRQAMPAGVPMRLLLEMKEFPQDAHSVTIRVLGFANPNWKHVVATLRGVPCVD